MGRFSNGVGLTAHLPNWHECPYVRVYKHGNKHKHTHNALGTYGHISAQRNWQLHIFLAVAFAMTNITWKKESFVIRNSFEDLQSFTVPERERSLSGGAVFVRRNSTTLNTIYLIWIEHVLVRFPGSAIVSFLPGCGRWVQKSAHASISLPLNYTVAHPACTVFKRSILYPWRCGTGSVLLAPPCGLCPERSPARSARVKGPPSRAGGNHGSCKYVQKVMWG